MRRGYWSGFLMGGLIGLLAFRAYGDEILGWMHSKLENSSGEEISPPAGPETAYRPRQRYRYRRTW